MPVRVADEVGRSTVSTPDLDDLGGLIRSTDNPSTNVKLVSNNGTHAHSSPEFSPQHEPFVTHTEGLGAFLDRLQTLGHPWLDPSFPFVRTGLFALDSRT